MEYINKALTNKCVIYHNDQGYKGIQAIIIEGNPCEAATYKILHCIPQISQHDVYIELKEVPAIL